MTEEALLATSAIPQDSNCGYGAPSSIVPQDRRISTLSMLILGIHSGTHDACACLFEDYRLLSAVALERLTRRKIDGDRVPPGLYHKRLARVFDDRTIESVLALGDRRRRLTPQIRGDDRVLRPSCRDES